MTKPKVVTELIELPDLPELIPVREVRAPLQDSLSTADECWLAVSAMTDEECAPLVKLMRGGNFIRETLPN